MTDGVHSTQLPQETVPRLDRSGHRRAAAPGFRIRDANKCARSGIDAMGAAEGLGGVAQCDLQFLRLMTGFGGTGAGDLDSFGFGYVSSAREDDRDVLVHDSTGSGFVERDGADAGYFGHVSSALQKWKFHLDSSEICWDHAQMNQLSTTSVWQLSEISSPLTSVMSCE
ncbi:hypothetical protein V7968_30285 [Nocardia vulneris]|uniref:hypothetical protein n=1 Tax=Nocardia vulneris TaxID=1141657 RepID=UPI0030CBE98C